MLSDQDREWVRAIVQEAVMQTLSQARSAFDAALEKHQKNCTFVLQSRAALWGIGVGAAVGGSGLTVLIQRLI